MPDVSRSDSQRSDSSAKPRVSFNRDVHVKRIGTAGAPRVVGALAGDSSGRLVPLAVRRERPTRLSRKDLAEEAKRVLKQADRIACTSQALGPPVVVDKYSTLPPLRKKKHRVLKHNHSLREKNPRLAKELVKEGGSSSSTERGSVERAKTSLTRSASDVGKSQDDSKTKFWSLDRLRAKKNKLKRPAGHVGSQSDVEKPVHVSSILSKRSLSDSERTPRRNSDSETGSLTNGKKKQLSPIIEVSPREDYFTGPNTPVIEEEADDKEVLTNNKTPKSPKTSKVIAVTNNTLLNNKQQTKVFRSDKSPKVPNRTKKVTKVASKNNEYLVRKKDTNNSLKKTNNLPAEEKMETILHSSQTISKPVLTRGLTVDTMVRKLSQERAGRGPPKVVSPLALVGPGEDRQHNNNLPFSYTEPSLFDTDRDGHVIANGFAKGASEQDNLSRSPTTRPTSDAVNGTDPTQVIYAEVICNGGGKAGALTKQTVHTSVPLSKVKETSPEKESSMGSERHNTSRYHTEYKTNLGDYTGSPSKIGNGIYRKEFISESRDYSAESRGRADGMDCRRNLLEDDSYRRVSPVRRNIMDEYDSQRSYSYDSKLDSRKFGDDRIEPVLQKPRILGNLDLSSRRDRLESKIESQRKDRLLSSRINESLNRSHQDVNDSRIIDNHRKYPSNPRLDSEYNRREFLNSQLNYDSLNEGRISSGDRYYSDGLRKSIDNIDKYDKKELTDSGIDINYHGPDAGKVMSEVRSYHNTYETTTNTEVNMRVPKQKSKSPKPMITNVTKVDVNGHIKNDGSDDEEDVNMGRKFYYNQQENIDQIMKRTGLQSAKLVQESKRSADVVPPSSVLIRHYAPEEGGHGFGSRTRREAEWAEERGTLKRKCELDDIEETRRFLVEERRRSVEERLDDECERRPEKVVQKKAKMETKAGKKKTGTMDKMKALFSRDSKKKSVKKEKEKEKDKDKDKDKKTVENQDPVTSRYVEYKGSNINLERETPTPRASSRNVQKASSNQLHVEESSRSRRERLPTPSPSPSRPSTLNRASSGSSRNVEQDSSGSWFKSLDRLRSKNKPKPKMDRHEPISENDSEEVTKTSKHNNNNNNVDKSNKNLRFFGDTDVESVRSHKIIKPMMSLPENPTRHTESGSQQSSTRYVPLRDSSNRRYKSSNNKLQVPRRRHHRSAGELATSSAESTTEGDSSQQSQRSVVYLHAATVGDIPGRVPSRNSRRARSREELSSTNGSTIQPHTRTVSRSISVLAPWKPRHNREGLEVHYENDSSRGGKPPKIPTNSTSKSTSTLNRLKNSKNESQKSYNTLSRDDSKDKENLSRKSLNSLNREGRRDKENYNKSGSTDSLNHDGVKSSRRGLNSAQSIESLGHVGKGKSRMSNGLNVSAVELNTSKGYRNGATLKKGKTENSKKRTELSRSVSMPKDSKVKSGWFRRKTRS